MAMKVVASVLHSSERQCKI